MVDRRVLNDVKPSEPEFAFEQAKADDAARRAAIQREEDARRVRDQAVIGGFTRAPDRPVLGDIIEDPNAPQLVPDVPAAPFEAVGLDVTALRTIKEAGVEMSPSTEKSVERVDEEEKIVARADRKAARAAESAAGGVGGGEAVTAEPNDPQRRATSAPNQASEPNQPNTPDQPSQPNQPNQPKATTATVDTKNLSSSTVADLRAYADKNKIDLSGAERKDDIIARIEKA